MRKVYPRSILGDFQIERDYVGCTNQVEPYENEIKEFIVPDIPLSRQEEKLAHIYELIYYIRKSDYTVAKGERWGQKVRKR